MKTIFAAAALLALAAGCTQQHTIEVTNASNANAAGEMAEVPWPIYSPPSERNS